MGQSSWSREENVVMMEGATSSEVFQILLVTK